ncbi:hypothetical protein J2Z21_005665 [Streptomyces griseochromogenes]|uniref:DUF397 domain-containing protein n=1 Tax=Streptomyces griseochromogenes TaxID=68214 RepID=A0A1B1BA31_9ACTN|nr:DUF397 domain-containing protein [Streptomyces griseochromogenes]ANP55688.1 DUF397 domain-containing protein [Streptomyces griseochromogenes]MBP2052678.1 hypothetical protein [Streptomyces griseochromogenes]
MKLGKGIDLSSVTWRKSSYSNNDGADCVEVADALPGVIPVRDSKRAQDDPVLLFRTRAWSAFLGSLKG